MEISNPLGEDFSVMRTTSLNGMLTSLSTNYNPVSYTHLDVYKRQAHGSFEKRSR